MEREIFLFACWDLESVVSWGHNSKIVSLNIEARKHTLILNESWNSPESCTLKIWNFNPD